MLREVQCCGRPHEAWGTDGDAAYDGGLHPAYLTKNILAQPGMQKKKEEKKEENGEQQEVEEKKKTKRKVDWQLDR